MFAGKNGEYSLTRDVDDAFSRALADMSKPFVTDSKDDSLTQFQAQSRLPDNMVVGLNDEELMRHLASVLCCRNTTNPMYEFADSISELSGGLVTNDLRAVTQALPTSSPWGMASVDSDGMTAMTSDTKLTYSNTEAACVPNGIVDHTHTSSVSNVAGFSSSFMQPSTGLTHLSSAVTATVQSVPLSSSLRTLPLFCSMAVQQMSESGMALSTPSVDAGMSSLDSLLSPIVTAPLLHVGSLPPLSQVLVSSPDLLPTSAAHSATLPSSRLPSLQTLPDVQTLMKPSRRCIVDTRPTVTSDLSILPFASIFAPFSTAYCPPPPVSSSTIKMDHPLATATVLDTVSVGGCSTSTVCSSALSNTAVSSLLPPLSVVQFTAGTTVFVPSALSGSSTVSHSGT